MFKYNLDVTDIQRSDENNVYMADKQHLYYNKSVNVEQQKIILYEITERYKFSSYLLDPKKHRFRTLVRIMSLKLCAEIYQTCKSKVTKEISKQQTRFEYFFSVI